jgi:hypothetical protein
MGLLIVGLTLAFVLIYAVWLMWLGSFSPLYANCIAHVHGRSGALYCNIALLGGDLRDYLVFAGQWLPFVALFGGLWIAGWRNERRLLPRRLRDRARRAARKSASQSSSAKTE